MCLGFEAKLCLGTCPLDHSSKVSHVNGVPRNEYPGNLSSRRETVVDEQLTAAAAFGGKADFAFQFRAAANDPKRTLIRGAAN